MEDITSSPREYVLHSETLPYPLCGYSFDLPKLFFPGQEKRQDPVIDSRRSSDGKTRLIALWSKFSKSERQVVNKSLHSFSHHASFLLLVLGSWSPEEDEQICSFLLAERGKISLRFCSMAQNPALLPTRFLRLLSVFQDADEDACFQERLISDFSETNLRNSPSMTSVCWHSASLTTFACDPHSVPALLSLHCFQTCCLTIFRNVLLICFSLCVCFMAAC